MRPEERENIRYSKGVDNPIDKTERIMFSLLPINDKNDFDRNKLLDIGCGVGTIGLELKKRNYIVAGIDFSKVAVEKCLAKGIEANVSDVDRDGLKFPDNHFDVVWAGDVIEHVYDPMFLFKEISRVLKKDGCLILSVPNDFNVFQRLKIFITGKSIQSSIYRRLKQCKHHTFFSWELLNYMLEQANISVNKYISIINIPKTKVEIISKNKLIGSNFGKTFIIRSNTI